MKIRQNVSLRDYSNYRIGGVANYFLEVSSKVELIDGLKEWDHLSKNFPDDKRRIFILAGGANVLIDDNGFNGLVIHNVIKDIKNEDNLVTVGSGILIKDFLEFCQDNSLTGFEWAGGLPGTIGGAIRGNAGAFGGETRELIIKVKSLDLVTLEEIERTKNQCLFDYRTSIFKEQKNNEFILSAVFDLKKGDKDKIKESIQEKIEHRILKHPMDIPSLGSTFKNIPFKSLTLENQVKYKDSIKNDPFPILPVAKLLHLAGLKGKRVGDAQISEKHPNFIVNLGNAKSEDVIKVIKIMKTEVKEKFGIDIEEEIVYLTS